METTQSAKVANWGSVCKRAQMQTVTSDFARIKTSAACRTFMSAKKCRLSTARSKISISQQKTWRYFKRCPGRNSSSAVKLWPKPAPLLIYESERLQFHVNFCMCVFTVSAFCVFVCRPSNYKGGKPPLELPLFSPSWLQKRKKWLHHCLPHSLFLEPDLPAVGPGSVSTVMGSNLQTEAFF